MKFLDCRDVTDYKKSHILGAASTNFFFTFLSMSDKKGIQDLTNAF